MMISVEKDGRQKLVVSATNHNHTCRRLYTESSFGNYIPPNENIIKERKDFGMRRKHLKTKGIYFVNYIK
jgi:hypothetical protein